MSQTIFFRSCLGVFQGGGCRAAALVGAYEEALKRGVQFIEVAGTSAGAIIAVLVGAGATPEQLMKFIEKLNFNNFLRPPQTTNTFTEYLAKPLGDTGNLVFHQGFHSSHEIENWMESCLRELLGPHQGPIPFEKLSLPTSVVATDILSRKPQIWNQRVSPSYSVAKAVRASCSIPIFFQAVDKQYVDGGVLSNLPSFVFANPASPRPLTNRILAFILNGDDERIERWGTIPFMKALANTVVDGAQELQTKLQENIHAIQIPTGAIRATDFNSITPQAIGVLLAAGREATAKFLNEEIKHIRGPRLPPNACLDKEDLYNSITAHLNYPIEELIILEHDTDFAYSLFPSLLMWKMRKVRIRIALLNSEPKPDGPYRRRLLMQMGIEVVELPAIPFRGYLINCHHHGSEMAYVAPEGGSVGVEAITYDGIMHRAAIAALHRQATLLFTSAPVSGYRPEIKASPSHNVLNRIKTVAQYNHQSTALTLESIRISELVALAAYVHEYKYRQIQHWAKEYNKAGVSLFDSATASLLDSRESIITPPVVEEISKGQYALIEGSTRAVYMRECGEERMYCIVARGIQDALPGETSLFRKVRIASRRLDTEIRYDKFTYSRFRKIEQAAHPLNSFL